MAEIFESVVNVADREVEGCIVLDINADKFTYPQTGVLKSRVGELLESGNRYFVLNASDIAYVDSYGLATILSALKLIKDHGGALALYGLNEMFSKLVGLTRLDRVLEIWPNEAQAIYYLSTLKKNLPTS